MIMYSNDLVPFQSLTNGFHVFRRIDTCDLISKLREIYFSLSAVKEFQTFFFFSWEENFDLFVYLK